MTRDRAGVRCSVERGVAWVTLSRPRRGNRIDAAMAQALCGLAEMLELDERVAVVVLAATGPDFCLGAEDGEAWERQPDWVAAIGRLSRPVVAAVHGDAVAEGCELVLACDLRIAAAGARLSLPQVTAARLPVHGATQRLPRLVGRTRAMDLLLTGRRVPAREALAMGLVSQVVPRRGFRAAVRREVAALRAKGPIALRLAKEAVIKGVDLTLDQGMRLEQDLYVLLQTTADRREGIRAFLRRRRPRFKGQ